MIDSETRKLTTFDPCVVVLYPEEAYDAKLHLLLSTDLKVFIAWLSFIRRTSLDIKFLVDLLRVSTRSITSTSEAEAYI